MARTTIFPTQEISYDFLFMDMVPAASITPAPFTLEPGQTYAVQWGENLFENLSVIDAGNVIPGALAIGNGSGFELPGNNEPFGIAYFANDNGGEIVVFFLDGNVSQTITVYQGADTPIVLKDRTGTGIEYEGVEGVRVFDKDGNAHVFVPPVETEEKTVELDFSGGAMEVTPTAGKLLSKVGIPVPENLLPENIAKDVDIAGVVGTHEGGGGNIGEPCICSRYKAAIWIDDKKGNSTTLELKVNFSASYEFLSARAVRKTQSATYALGSTLQTDITGVQFDLPTTETVSGATRTISCAIAVSGSTSRYSRELVCLSVSYINPYFYIERKNGITTMRAYSDTNLGSVESFLRPVDIPDVLDLSGIQGAVTLPGDRFETVAAKKIIFPPGITIPANAFHYTQYATEYAFAGDVVSIGSGAFYGNGDKGTHTIVFDFSKCTTVPKSEYSNIMGNLKNRCEIRVPEALYEEWITAQYWTQLANNIVPV